MKPLLVTLLFMVLSVFCLTASANRYAIVVGNNNGLDQEGKKRFSDLKKAEEEAGELSEQLNELCNFKKENIVLLQGDTRDKVLEEVERIAEEIEKEQEKHGISNTLFALFFTGHGLKGQLLMEDGPLTSEDIKYIFNRVDAKLKIFFVDACYSGSILPKGVVPIRNENDIIPKEVIQTEGNVWLFSSDPDNVSYEGEDYGGIFTHFFIEALEEASYKGTGITFHSIWEYTFIETMNYAEELGVIQQPSIASKNLKESGLFYFSFPEGRIARLILEDPVHGEFILSYSNWEYSEVIIKKAGERLEIPVFPGRVRLTGAGKNISEEFLLSDKIVLSNNSDIDKIMGTNRKKVGALSMKGEEEMVITQLDSDFDPMLGVRLELSDISDNLLMPGRLVGVGFSLDWSHLHLGLSVGYGFNHQAFDSWDYDVHAINGELQLGFGVDLKQARLNISGSFGTTVLKAIYVKAAYTRFAINPAVRLGLVYPTSRSFLFEVFFKAGSLWTPYISRGGPAQWHFNLGAGVWIVYRFD